MRKLKQLTAILLTLIFLLSGCSSSRNALKSETDTATKNVFVEDNTEKKSEENTEKKGEESTDDVSVNNGTTKYNYNFSIYDDGRTFSKAQIAVQSDFEDFLGEVFADEMTENSINLHFSIENPENYGIADCEPDWGDFDYLDTSDDRDDLNSLLTELKSYDYNALTYEQQLIYDIFKDYLENELTATDYLLFSSAFAPMSGVQSELPVIFSEYDFRKKEDIDDYISLLNTSSDYVKTLCEYEKYRLSKGYSLSSTSLDTVIKQCRDFLDAEPNCLRPVFEDKLKAFGSLSDTEIAQYMDAFDKGITESLKPSYELIITTLTEIKEADKSKGGLCNYDNGKDYYKYLVKYNTGSSHTIDELYKMMEDEMSRCALGVSTLFMKNENLDADMSSYECSITDPDEMLQSLITSLEEDFPAAVNNNYTINYVPESLEATMNPAYYVIPPIDNINRNNIYINRNEEYQHMNLFSTIAHEGFPGHMYQTNYFYSLNPHYFRSLLSFNGYAEGWAQYIETCYSYKYSDMDEDLAKAFEYNASVSFALYCMTDIGVNYLGWDYEETSDFLSLYVGGDDEVISEIYYTMVDEPSVYLRYYVGYLEFLSLKNEAQDKLGSGFDVKEFHRFLLEIGPCQFDIIGNRMDGWMDRVMEK